MNLINGLRVIDNNVNNTDITYPQQLSQSTSFKSCSAKWKRNDSRKHRA